MEKIIAERYEVNAKGVVVAKIDLSPTVKKGMPVGAAKGTVLVKGTTYTLDQVKEMLGSTAKAEVEAKPAKVAKVAKPVKEVKERQPKGEGYSVTKGINFDKNSGRYQMRFCHEGKAIYIATLDTEEEAIEAQKKLGNLFKKHYEAKRPEFDTDIELIKALYIQYLKPKKAAKPAKVEAVAKPAKAALTKSIAAEKAKPVAKKAKSVADEL